MYLLFRPFMRPVWCFAARLGVRFDMRFDMRFDVRFVIGLDVRLDVPLDPRLAGRGEVRTLRWLRCSDKRGGKIAPCILRCCVVTTRLQAAADPPIRQRTTSDD